MTEHDLDQISGADMADVDQSVNPRASVNYLDAATRRSLDAKISSYAKLGLARGDAVLDIGCGTGDDVRRMAEIVGSTGRAVGLDSSEVMVAQARARSEGTNLPAEFVQGSAYELPFENDSFDACRCERVLQHLDEPLAAIREMMRVVRPGGRVLLLDPDFGSGVLDTSHPEIHERMRLFGQKWRETQPGSGWRGRQLWGLAHQAGLEAVEIEGLTITITSYRAANALAGLETRTAGAVKAGVVSQEEADMYLEDLRDRDAANRFFTGITGFQVVGTAPSVAE